MHGGPGWELPPSAPSPMSSRRWHSSPGSELSLPSDSRRSGASASIVGVSCPGFAVRIIAVGMGLDWERMMHGDHKPLVRTYYEQAVGTGDVSRIDQFIAPGYTEVYRGSRHEPGIGGARDHVLGVRRTYPDLQITVERPSKSCIEAMDTHILGEPWKPWTCTSSHHRSHGFLQGECACPWLQFSRENVRVHGFFMASVCVSMASVCVSMASRRLPCACPWLQASSSLLVHTPLDAPA
jgi:hypothetical protein